MKRKFMLWLFLILLIPALAEAKMASYKITEVKGIKNGRVLVRFEFSDGKRKTRAFSNNSTKEFILRQINCSCYEYFKEKAESENLVSILSSEKNVDKEFTCPLPVIEIAVEAVGIGSKEVEIKVKAISRDLEDKSIIATLQVGDEVKKDITADWTEKKSFDTFGEKIIIVEAVDCKGQKTEVERRITLIEKVKIDKVEQEIIPF